MFDRVLNAFLLLTEWPDWEILLIPFGRLFIQYYDAAYSRLNARPRKRLIKSLNRGTHIVSIYHIVLYREILKKPER